jgi:hypothetical protein
MRGVGQLGLPLTDSGRPPSFTNGLGGVVRPPAASTGARRFGLPGAERAAGRMQIGFRVDTAAEVDAGHRIDLRGFAR